MRKSTEQKISEVIRNGKLAAAAIEGHENIKLEVENLVRWIEELSLKDANALHYDDALFRLGIISFALEIDLLRNPQNKIFDAMENFKKNLSDTVEFFRSITKEEDPAEEYKLHRGLNDVAFQGNILLFYTHGEIEKCGQNENIFKESCGAINKLIHSAHSAINTTDTKPLSAAIKNLQKTSTALKEKGGAFKIIAEELANLAERTLHLV
jgi:hypothetical protein